MQDGAVGRFFGSHRPAQDGQASRGARSEPPAKCAPDLPRPFRTPLWWFVGPAAVAGCLYLFTTLPVSSLVNFLIWNAIGVVAYLAYGRVKSRLATA